MRLRNVVITCKYPDDEVEAAVPQNMSPEELLASIKRLLETEREMVEFTLTASVFQV